MSGTVPGGVVHDLPAARRTELASDAAALAAWRDITELARNEFICWVQDAKQDETRQRRISTYARRAAGGQRRPCCWPGCTHRS